MPKDDDKKEESGDLSKDSFRKNYISSNRGKYILIWIFIVIFAVAFLQVVCINSTGCNASGLVGSSVGISSGEGDTLNPYCVGITEVLAVICLCGLFLYLGRLFAKNSAIDKLIEQKEYTGALVIGKGEEPSQNVKTKIYKIEIDKLVDANNNMIKDEDEKLIVAKQGDLLEEDEDEDEDEYEEEDEEEEEE